MDAGRVSSGSIRRPLQEAPHRYRVTSDNYTNRHKPSSSAKLHYDRFIPNRGSMDMDFANFMLSQPKKETGNNKSPSKVAYRKALSETLFQNRTRILSFKSKPQTSIDPIPLEPRQQQQQQQHAKLTRHIPQSAVRMLGAPDIIDDYYLNLVDWGCKNVLAIALGSTVYLWDASTRSTSELVTVDESCGHVTSVNWAPDGKNIAIGLNNSDVQLWDSYSNRLLRTLKGTHDSRVGALSWNDHLLTSGGMDGLIVNSDVRIRDHVVHTYEGHTEEVCGLKWSGSGQQLASGGSDSLLHIWDLSMASSRAPPNQHQWLHRRNDHVATVKALAWCPFQNNLLASGGGAGDRCIKFWNTQTGASLNSVDTGSQVSGLLWNKNEMELLSSHGHGFTMENQLTLWNYPSMMKMAELTGHASRVLFMAQSPDGSTVASAGADEELRFWNVFGTPQPPKSAKSVKSLSSAPFSSFSFIR